MEPTLEIFATHVIVVGSFNPPVITPDWLAANDLIGEGDAKAAMEAPSLAITPDISRFETDWFSIQVVKQQCAIASKGPVTPALKDLFVGIFTLLAHTPITALGLNHHGEYKISTTQDFHKIGDMLAPKTIWNEFYPDSDTLNVGLQSLTVLVSPWKRGEAARPERQKRVTIGPSDKLDSGVHLGFNDHFPIVQENKKQVDCAMAIQIVEQHFQESIDEAQKLFAHVLKSAISTENKK